MLVAYVDDSTSEESHKTFVLAGYVQNAETWARFSDDWQAVLDASPSIKYFKMREAESLRKEFLGWEPIVRNAKVHALAEIVQKHKPWSIEVSLSRSLHKSVVRPVLPYDIRSPYFDAFYAVIIKLAQWHRELRLTIPVDFVFDEQGVIGAEAAMWYEHIKSIQPSDIRALLGSTPVFRDDKLVLPLQAVDMLAWHIRRGKENRNRGEYRPVAEKLFPLLHASVVIGEDALRNLASQLSQVPGVKDMTEKKDSIKGAIQESLERERRLREKNEGK